MYFSKHYALVHASRSDVAVGNTILSAILDSALKRLPLLVILLGNHLKWRAHKDTT